jgi:thiol-disulfide isomerase/thioredoxin
MKIYKSAVLIGAISLLCSATYSQGQKTDISGLKVGDKIPDVVLSQIINYKSASASLKTMLGDRYLIIDFFATWCVPCVRALPELQSLQKKYRDKLLILPVSEEPETVIRPFLKKHSELDNTLSFVVNDKNVKKIFPHYILPNEVWIDKNGIVKAISAGGYVDAAHIEDFINDKKVDLVQKSDNMNFSLERTLIDNYGADNYQNALVYSSALTKRLEGAGTVARVDQRDDSLKRISVSNISPLVLYFIAYYNGLNGVNYKRFALNIDSTKVKPPKDQAGLDKWHLTHTFCYELQFDKPVRDSNFYQYMFQDLNRLFDFKGVIKKRKMPSYVLVRTTANEDKLATAGGPVSPVISGKMRNTELSKLIAYLNRLKDMEPVIDETNYKGKVDMDLEFIRTIDIHKYPDIALIDKSLNRYGLTLKKEIREVDFLYLENKTAN